jgi:uncharacterized YigZ family protein
MVLDTYRTIAHSSEGLYKDKGSRFISFAYPVENEDQIKKILGELKKIHFSARHICYAWRLGTEQIKYRTNDDGEPSGSAGKPIFGQLQSHNLTNVLIVVVRYFGGTLLGVSGLILAYKQAAKEAISNSSLVTQVIEQTLVVSFDYLGMNDLMQLIKEEHLEIMKSQFGLRCEIEIKVRSAKLKEIKSQIENLDKVFHCVVVQIQKPFNK